MRDRYIVTQSPVPIKGRFYIGLDFGFMPATNAAWARMMQKQRNRARYERRYKRGKRK